MQIDICLLLCFDFFQVLSKSVASQIRWNIYRRKFVTGVVKPWRFRREIMEKLLRTVWAEKVWKV